MGKALGRDEAVAHVAEALGRLMEFWGFKRVMGRTWATLYLSPRALSASELCEQLSISAGAASMTLAELERWGVVHRLFRTGERREFFEAETSVWKMIARVYEQREAREIERLIEAMEAALDALAKHRDGGDDTRFAAARVKKLLDLSRLGRTLIGSLLSAGRVDVEPLKRSDD